MSNHSEVEILNYNHTEKADLFFKAVDFYK